MERTSPGDSLRIASIEPEIGLGRIGFTSCPDGPDLDAIRTWGAAAVVTLMTAEELAALGLESLADDTAKRDMLWFHCPVRAGAKPQALFANRWTAAQDRLHGLLRDGRDIVVQCSDGRGRAGTVAALLLIELGWSQQRAIDAVRTARPGAIQARGQEMYVMARRPAAAPPTDRHTDWFEALTGFREREWADTKAALAVDGTRLVSRVNGARYEIGTFELASLAELRARVRAGDGPAGRPRVSIVRGNVREMHRDSANAGALFQVASQFNMLEMVDDLITPEMGVTIYQSDPTQGPACAIAAGAATIWRNYFVPVGEATGQTEHRQLDGLADLGKALAQALDHPAETLWEMRNGYALPKREMLDRINRYLVSIDHDERDALRGLLRVGLHRDVEATEATTRPGPLVSQAFCSALPVNYSGISGQHWTPFARLVLEATYEATLWEAVLNARRGASKVAFLTFVGGGAFGNDALWIHDALRRAVRCVAAYDLDLRLVSYGAPTPAVEKLAADLA